MISRHVRRLRRRLRHRQARVMALLARSSTGPMIGRHMRRLRRRLRHRQARVVALGLLVAFLMGLTIVKLDAAMYGQQNVMTSPTGTAVDWCALSQKIASHFKDIARYVNEGLITNPASDAFIHDFHRLRQRAGCR
jgi:hypothetical protein